MKSRTLLLTLLALSVVSPAWADDSGSCGTSVTYTYTESNHTLTISGTGAVSDYEISPDNRPWAAYSDDITTVVIEEGVTALGCCAFARCTNLVTVNFAEESQLTIIDAGAFAECNSLEAIVIPNNVTTIGNNALSYNNNLASVTIGSGVTNMAFDILAGCPNLTSISVADGSTRFVIDDGVLFNKNKTALLKYPAKKSGTSYEIPSSVTYIEGFAFEYSHLTNITIPNSVTSIGYGAFQESNTTSITIGSGVTYLDANVFNVSSVQTIYFLRTESPFTYPYNNDFNPTSFIVPAAAYDDYLSDWNYDPLLKPGYTITCGEGVTTNANGPLVLENEIVTLSNNRLGYTFNGYTSSDVVITEGQFTMPASNVTVSATWTATAVDIDDGVGNVITADDEITVPTLDYIRDIPTPGATPDANVGGVDVDVYTLCLPYAPATGEGIKYYTLSGATASTLQFTEITDDPVANTPYLVTVSAATSVGNSIASPVELKKEVANSVTAGDYIFKGTTIGLTNAEAVTAGAYILMAGNQWGQVQAATLEHPEYGNAYIPPFRAYVVSASGARSLDNEFGNDDTTRIQSLQLIDRNGTEQWFDLSGRRIEKPTSKGIYIHNGKKLIVK